MALQCKKCGVLYDLSLYYLNLKVCERCLRGESRRLVSDSDEARHYATEFTSRTHQKDCFIPSALHPLEEAELVEEEVQDKIEPEEKEL